MPEYDLLIFDKDANPTAFIKSQQIDDDDAIRAAALIADGRPFEVWRDVVCVHQLRAGRSDRPVRSTKPDDSSASLCSDR